MRIEAPKVDDRNALDIAGEVRRLLDRYMPAVRLNREHGPAFALVNVFARFGEIIIDRINRAPEKNFLAFLDLLGISPVPQQAARAPVTFYLAAGRIDEAVVPKLTQVAAEPGKGEQAPVVFETERELVVVSTRLESLFAKYSKIDQYVDYHSVLPELELAQASESKEFAPPRPSLQLIPHVLYIGLPYPPNLPVVDELRLSFVLEETGPGPLDTRTVRWEFCRKAPEVTPKQEASSPSSRLLQLAPAGTLIVAQDATENLRKSGEVVFQKLLQWPVAAIGGEPSRWIRCQLQTPISYKLEHSPETVRETHLPRIKTLTVSLRSQRDSIAPVFAFANNAKLDLTKDFYPFGEKPKFGDTFYLACDEAFSLPDTIVTLRIVLTNPSAGGPEPAIPRVNPMGIRLRWEFWDGETWSELGTSDLSQHETGRRIRILGESDEVTTDFADTTRAFSESEGEVSFRFSRAPQKLALNGQHSFWIRVRIIAGDYGRDAYFEREGSKGPVLVPASLAPPSISRITVGFKMHRESPAEVLLTYNDWQFGRIQPTQPAFSPFLAIPKEDRSPMVYFGFSLPVGAEESPAVVAARARKAPFPARSMSIYIGLGPSGPGQRPPAVSSQTSVEWEYWNGLEWVKWTVRDETLGLRRSGLVRFLAPPDFAVKKEFGQEKYWLRVRQTDDDFRANLGVVALNTTMATHCVTGINEVLGTSNGQPKQTFKTTRAPVLEGQKLEVREQIMPSVEECRQIMAEEGDDAIQRIAALAGKGDEFWVRWHEVANFYHSRSRDRHYILNRAAGEITFGDGTHGMIPSPLAGNIRLASYRTGGGAVGNKPPLTIKQLKSAVPYIKSAMNWEAADGGADEESAAALLERGPTQVRHGGRAITTQDVEDLARRVSPEVARAMCVPLYDLVADSAMTNRKPGVVSVIVVPQSAEPQPFPSSDLLLRVQSALQSSGPPAADVRVLGPEYVAAEVDVSIAVTDPDTVGDVKLAVTLAINRYLHPVNGGLDESGWEFGRLPQKSELFNLIEGINGVHHVIGLKLDIAGGMAATSERNRFLICAGRVGVSAVLEEQPS